eukprot:TRINITY_DN3233_c3_g3_i1.p2 TRINITY_DN3233_c3_g3~~TRINITY_DN3233_c3_g3_i1.p2  ORF type:complete len:60 (-),score=10.05 TRINITY_DN3233_c3_g3_i1:390-569(-)
MKVCHDDVCSNIFIERHCSNSFCRFVDVVMVLTYLHSRNSQIKLARVPYVESNFQFFFH